MRRAFSVAVLARHGGVGGDVLLVRHKRLELWLPVGGEIETVDGRLETPLEAAVRELKEETGLDGAPPAPPSEGTPSEPLGVPGRPPGLLAYEEHEAGEKGLHLNFDFVLDVDHRDVRSDGSWDDHVWVGREVPADLDVPENVARVLGLLRAWEAGEDRRRR